MRHRASRRLLLATLVVLAGIGCDRPGAEPRPRTADEPSSPAVDPLATPGSDRRGDLYLAWQPGGFPPGGPAVALRAPGVEAATEVIGGVHWLLAASSGSVPPSGYAFPFDVAYVRPPSFTRVWGFDADADRDGDAGYPGDALGRLKDDAILMARGALRTAKGVLSLRLDAGTFTMRGLLPNPIALGYEGVLAGPAPEGWGDRFLLIRTTGSRASLREELKAWSPGPLRLRNEGETAFLRYADGVVPLMFLKDRFGEFGAIARSDGTLAIEPRWRERNIVDATVPILGKVTCHRRFTPSLRRVLSEVKERGLMGRIIPGDFAGCYSPRFIGRDPAGRISSHAWGAAADLNATANAVGTRPTMDAGIVAAFKAEGFRWGGDWLIPDGMHFEWGSIGTIWDG